MISFVLLIFVFDSVLSESIVLDNESRGCKECASYRCPEDPTKCPQGPVSDPCGCCSLGLCAKIAGEACWNSSILELPSKRINEGFCGTNYTCQLRFDLQSDDEQEAICICKDGNPVCGSNNVTYESTCSLHEDSVRSKDSTLILQHSGPCQSVPWIVSSLEDVVVNLGQRVALNCEAKGFPLPEIFWEFHSSNGQKIIRLPSSEEHDATVNTSEGPEPLMKTSWMQVSHLKSQQVGVYHCIANNSLGLARDSAAVSLWGT